MRKIQIQTEVVGGKLKNNSGLIREAIESFEGQRVIITVEKAKKKRSNEQNAYWWGVAIPVVQKCLKEAGMTRNKQQTHDLIGDLVLQKYGHTPLQIEIDVNGQLFEEKRGTSELTTVEFMEYVAMVQMFAAEVFGVQIPDPGQGVMELST